MQAEAGKKVKGKVTGITSFGAFVRLEDGSNGLIHISQVADDYVANVGDFLSVGQDVEPTVLSVDEKGRISLSLKTGKRKEHAFSVRDDSQPMLYETAPMPTGFEDMLSRYKSASEEKIGDLRKMQGGKAHKRKVR